MDPGSTVQRINLQAGVIRQCDLAGVGGDRPGLLECIGLEGVSILFDFGGVRIGFERTNVDVVAQECGDLFELTRVSRGDDERSGGHPGLAAF